MEHSEWAAPIVPVVKEDGSLRICSDYTLTVNKASSDDQYPMPNVEDLFATLAGGHQFTKLDWKQAFAQIPLSEDSRKYTTINTPLVLFQYT